MHNRKPRKPPNSSAADLPTRRLHLGRRRAPYGAPFFLQRGAPPARRQWYKPTILFPGAAMLQDALLAWFHYLAIFLLIVIMTAEAVLLRPGLSPDTVRRLALYDRLYLASALAVLVTGLLRLTLGAKGVAFYMSNPWFHAKIRSEE